MNKKLSWLFFTVLTCTQCSFSIAEEVKEDHWNGEEYHGNSSSQKEAAGDLLKHLAFQGDESVLDIGSGDGKITAAIAKQLISGAILGIDISPSMIEFADLTFPRSQYPNLEFKLMAAEDIAFIQEFDFVLSFTTLQWVKDHRLVIAKVQQSLKPEGIFAATQPMGLPRALETAVREAISQKKWKDYFIDFETGWNFATPEEYREYLKAEGFTIRRLEVVLQEDIFPSLSAFKGFISQWFPYLRPLPKNEKEKFMDQVLARYLELDPLDSSGQLHFRIRRLETVAEKR